MMTPIDQRQQAVFDAMSPAERVQYAGRVFDFTRASIEHQIRIEFGEISPDEMSYRIALRMYGDHPALRQLIEERLAHVSA